MLTSDFFINTKELDLRVESGRFPQWKWKIRSKTKETAV